MSMTKKDKEILKIGITIIFSLLALMFAKQIGSFLGISAIAVGFITIFAVIFARLIFSAKPGNRKSLKYFYSKDFLVNRPLFFGSRIRPGVAYLEVFGLLISLAIIFSVRLPKLPNQNNEDTTVLLAVCYLVGLISLLSIIYKMNVRWQHSNKLRRKDAWQLLWLILIIIFALSTNRNTLWSF